MDSKRYITALICSCLLALASCTRPYEAHYDFGFDREELRFAAADTALYFMVYGEGEWTLRFSEEASWVSIDKYSGRGTTQINVRIMKNEGISREVKVIGRYEDGREKEIILSQLATSGKKSYTLDYQTLDLLKIERNLTVPSTPGFVEGGLSDLEYWIEYDSEGQDWLENLNFNYTDVTFSVKENTTASDRSAHIFWTYPVAHWETPDTLSVKVVQNTLMPTIELKESYSLDSEGADSLKIVPVLNWDQKLYNFDISNVTVSDGISADYSVSGGYLALIAPANNSGEVKNFQMEWSVKDDLTQIGSSTAMLTQNFFIPPTHLTPNGEYANCYILKDKSEAYYSIDVLLVSGARPSDDIVSAAIVWETSLGLVTKCSYNKEENRLYVGKAKNAKGNAVIKLMNADGKVRWSYHFWMTDMDADVPDVTVGGVVFMDRNIGAMTNQAPVTSESDAAGMHYQWGRKDPFPPARDLSSANGLQSTVYPQDAIVYLSEQESTTYNTGVSLETAISNPSTYYWGKYSTSASKPIAEDWSSTQNDDYWKTDEKTVYDPCPYGYVVPSEEQMTKYINAEHTDVMYNTLKMGTQVKCDDGGTNFWCASGWYRRTYNSSSQMANVGKHQYYWCTDSDVLANTNDLYNGARATQSHEISTWPRRWGANVRCVKETKTE